ncbi:serpin family protein [Endozoicomonas sp. 4G]|uniref:serpin family protein n=1 Tax=Endozoicomonas sp. 4G TaxID=2872754 RepID=UPI0020790223|nr:serpin family protein [Endozoicomonas sp. 4G]
MVLLRKSSDPVCRDRVVLVLALLLCSLAVHAQNDIVSCPHCGFPYYKKEYASCPSCKLLDPGRPKQQAAPSTSQTCSSTDDQEDFTFHPAIPLQHDTAPSQAVTTVNPDAQMDESLRNLEFAVNVFSRAAPNIPENFVLSPDSFFQTLALSVLNAGADGATEQWRRIGQDTHAFAQSLLAAGQLEPQAIYKERLKQIHDDLRDNVNLMKLTPMHSLARELNGLFCQLTHGMVQRFCNPIAYPLSRCVELIASIYFTDLLERSRGTEHEALFTLPDGQAALVNRIMDGKINPSQYTHHNDWEAFAFPYLKNDEVILIFPPAGVLLHTLRLETIRTLLSSLNARESFPSSSTVTSELPLPDIDTNIDLSEALSGSASGLAAVVTSGLSSGTMSAVPALMSALSKQAAPSAASTGAGSKRTHEGDTIPSMRFDRPSIYMLRNNITERIFYIGQILTPLR